MNVKSNFILTMLRSPHVNVLVLVSKKVSKELLGPCDRLAASPPPPQALENTKVVVTES